MYDELVKALRNCKDTMCGDCAIEDECSNVYAGMRLATDAIEKLMAEIDHKDKVIQGFLAQIERFSAETSTLQNRIEHQNATIDSLYKTIEKLTEQKENGNE